METSHPSSVTGTSAPAPSRRHVPPDFGRRALTLLAVAAGLLAVLLGLGFLLTSTGLGAAVGAADMAVLQWIVARRTAGLDAATAVMSGFASRNASASASRL